MPQIEATKRFPFGKRVVEPGDVVEMTEKQARLWKGLKRAVDHVGSVAPKAVDLPKEVMSRAPVKETKVVVAEPVEEKAEEPAPKRHYRRRDMSADQD